MCNAENINQKDATMNIHFTEATAMLSFAPSLFITKKVRPASKEDIKRRIKNSIITWIGMFIEYTSYWFCEDIAKPIKTISPITPTQATITFPSLFIFSVFALSKKPFKKAEVYAAPSIPLGIYELSQRHEGEYVPSLQTIRPVEYSHPLIPPCHEQHPLLSENIKFMVKDIKHKVIITLLTILHHLEKHIIKIMLENQAESRCLVWY